MKRIKNVVVLGIIIVIVTVQLAGADSPPYSGTSTPKCDVAWYRGGGTLDGHGGTWPEDNIEDAFVQLENAGEINCWEEIPTARDVIEGALFDDNGDRKYNLIFFMGGSGTTYNNGLGDVGEAQIKKFVSDGGGYVGTCAGAFYASTGRNFIGLFDGSMTWTGDTNRFFRVDYDLTGHEINEGFGSVLHDVQFANGGWLEADVPNTEYIATYSTSDSLLNGYPSVTVNYYGNGKVVLSGAHPEADTGPNNLEYFKRLITYALNNDSSQVIVSGDGVDDGGGGCFIDIAAYATHMAQKNGGSDSPFRF